jgi:demethylmenaquinone methyltransferase/2-methoxy-6-polyprenyl-1,4-benzoquinol methylase
MTESDSSMNDRSTSPKAEPVWDKRRLGDPHDQPDKAGRVRQMFDQIAPTYQRINSLASLGRDRYWRSEMVRLAAPTECDILLDIACGTGDVIEAFLRNPHGIRSAVGLDFSSQMLTHARQILKGSASLTQGDALRLPIADASVTVVTCAFGIRNFQQLDIGLGEMYRVLSEGGRAVILDFSLPKMPVVRQVCSAYMQVVLPLLGRVVGRDRTGAYRYLPRSVLSFHGRDEIVASLQAVGFRQVSVHPLTFGAVTVYVARKMRD